MDATDPSGEVGVGVSERAYPKGPIPDDAVDPCEEGGRGCATLGPW